MYFLLQLFLLGSPGSRCHWPLSRRWLRCRSGQNHSRKVLRSSGHECSRQHCGEGQCTCSIPPRLHASMGQRAHCQERADGSQVVPKECRSGTCECSVQHRSVPLLWSGRRKRRRRCCVLVSTKRRTGPRQSAGKMNYRPLPTFRQSDLFLFYTLSV